MLLRASSLDNKTSFDRKAKVSVRLSGFTVVEMVVVITLLAILSTVAISRLVGPSSFDPLLLRDYLVAQNAHRARLR